MPDNQYSLRFWGEQEKGEKKNTLLLAVCIVERGKKKRKTEELDWGRVVCAEFQISGGSC